MQYTQNRKRGKDNKYTSDYDKKNEFNIEQFLSRRLKLKAGDEFVVVDAD